MYLLDNIKNKIKMTGAGIRVFLSNSISLIKDKYNNVVKSEEVVILQGPMIEENIDESFLDTEFNDLNKRPLYQIRKMLLNDIEDFNLLPRRAKIDKMDQLFKKILKFQPMEFDFSYRSFENDEQRFFIDVISTPGFLDNPAVEEFLTKYFSKNQFDTYDKLKYDLLLKFMDYYKTHDKEDIDKVNYIFKSCDGVAWYLFNNPDLSFDLFFNKNVLPRFDKDDLAYLYRFNYDQFRRFTFSKNDTALLVLSELYNKVKEVSGPNYEFLQSMHDILGKKEVVTLLESYYEWVKVTASGKEFADAISLKDNMGTSELIKYLIYFSFEGYRPCSDIVEFLNVADEKRKKYHEAVLGKGAVEKVFYGVYDESDLPNVSDIRGKSLDRFKRSFFEYVYGIDSNKAAYIADFYGKHLDEFYKCLPPRPEGMSTEEWLNSLDESKLAFKKEDYVTLQILTSICNISKLSSDDEKLDEKLSVLQKSYLKNVNEKGILGNSNHICFPVLENALNQLYLNSFTKRVMKTNDCKKIIGAHEGVMLLDAGVEFDMIVTSIGAVNNIFNEDVNMALKWNTASGFSCQGLCTSHISSQNMGVFTIGSPILGFEDFDGTSLNMMGTSDIWTNTYTPYLKYKNQATIYKNRTFVPGSIMADETRYGYNELLLDRFINDDSENNKLQPSYVVYYKFDDEYKEDQRFKDSLKIAADFNVPIMVVDVYKIKDFERQEINKMKEELFSKDVVDPELVSKIITRYMNNYVGAANFVGYFKGKSDSYPKDFAKDDLVLFIEEYLQKAKVSSSEKEFFTWTDALYDVYCEESRKYAESRRVSPESYSLTSFFLDDIKTIDRLNSHYHEFVETLEDSQDKQSDFVNVSIPISDMSGSSIVSLQIVEALNKGKDLTITKDDSNYVVSCLNDESLEDKLYSSLVISYLFENTNPIIDDVISSNGKKEIDINAKNNYDFVSEMMNSSYKDQLLNCDLNNDKMNGLITKVETDAMSLCKYVFPYLNVKYNMSSSMDIINNMINKSTTIREDFDKLKKAISSLKTGEDNIGETGKKL